MPSFYNQGTATVAANGTAVTGHGTAWLDTVRPGDLFGTHKGAGVRIASVNSNTSLTLAYAWPGGVQTAAAYEIQFTPYLTNPQQDLQALINLLGSGVNYALGGLNGAGGNKIPRLTGAGTADTIDATNLAALAGLAGVADRIAYFTGVGAMTLSTLTAYARTLLAATQIDGALTTLGGGAIGREVFKAVNSRDFLIKSGVGYNLGAIADDAAVSFPGSTSTEGYLVYVGFNVPSRSGLYVARTAASANSIAPIGVIAPAPTLTTGVLGGTTGADGALTIAAGSNGRIYIENRLGSPTIASALCFNMLG